MRDLDVRRVLEARLSAEHQRDHGTRIVHELGVCRGVRRVDLAVINGSMTGYEIKSAADRLDRLPEQAQVYSRVFDTIHLAVAECHAKQALAMVPASWGVLLAAGSRENVTLELHREAKENPDVEAQTLAGLLWREEALQALELVGRAKGLRSKPRSVLTDALAATLSLDQIGAIVRQALKARVDWRSV